MIFDPNKISRTVKNYVKVIIEAMEQEGLISHIEPYRIIFCLEFIKKKVQKNPIIYQQHHLR